MEINCPICGASYYWERYTVSTAMYSPIVYKNGKIINKDPNWHTTYCLCLNCGADFCIRRYEDKIEICKEQ